MPSPQIVGGKVDKMYKAFLKAAKEQRQYVGQQYKDGLTISEIARKLKLSRQRVHQIVDRYYRD